MAHRNQPQPVFLITNGSSVLYTGVDRVERVHVGRTRQLFETAAQIDRLLKFWFMPGWLCSGVLDLQGRLEVQPQFIAPIPFLVKVLDYSIEFGSPRGVALLVEVRNIFSYEVNLPRGCKIPIITAGDKLEISYHIEQGIGGFSKVNKQLPREHLPPTVNSRSELQRECVIDPTCHHCGRSVYKIAGTCAELPVHNTLDFS